MSQNITNIGPSFSQCQITYTVWGDIPCRPETFLTTSFMDGPLVKVRDDNVMTIIDSTKYAIKRRRRGKFAKFPKEFYDYYNKVDRLLFDLQKEKEKAVQEKLIKVKHVKKGKPIGLML